MLRYVLVFLLVNAYGRSLGLPVEQQTGNGTIKIGNLLSELAKGCKNELVTSLISTKLNECNLEMPPIRKSQIRCLMFYDASVVLCNLTTKSPEQVTDFDSKTKATLDVSKFCKEAAHFNLPPTRFRTNITEVLHKAEPCTVVCADDEDFLIGKTSFYCKYYKWMLGIVHAQMARVANALSVNRAPIDTQQKTNETLVTDAASASIGLPKRDGVEESSSDTNNKTTTIAVDVNQNHAEAAPAGPSLAPLPNKPGNKSEIAQESRNPSENNIDGAQQDNSDRNGVQIESILMGNGAAKPNSGLDGEEEDDNEDQADQDAGGDGMDEADMDNRPEQHVEKDKQDETPVIIHPESSHGDTYLNPIEGYTEDDDHFFPFFLTMVIVVVVLYVLYHNKNKVGKMFFGLIVEGRQTGRRRTSRGHAYRRLDTLEQAMSANSAAPPSKIIY